MSLRLWLHAARAAPARQLSARATRPIRRRRFPQGPQTSFRPLAENAALWISQAFDPLGARPDEGSRLATFHRDYGDDVLLEARTGGDAVSIAGAWVAAHPPRDDDAWHPYVASTRVANWIAAATLESALVPVVEHSLRRALARVEANIENDVLGNHVIRNAKALVLGGIAFGDEALRRRGISLLERELREQVLPDGGHYERSPAYHRVVLRDLLELRAYTDIEAQISGMTAFAASSSRPDGAPWLFNDGGVDVAPHLELPPCADGVAVFEETGYVFVRRGDLSLAFDCGPVSPPFLPAHAHADALSFQLWLRGLPVVLDPGMPTYDAGPERDFFRSTRAHSTVSAGHSQFESWGAFRAGPLPAVELIEAGLQELVGRVRSAHGSEHVRRLRLETDALVVQDEARVEDARDVVSTLVVASTDTGIESSAGTIREERTVSERFGERRSAHALVQRGIVVSEWRIPLG